MKKSNSVEAIQPDLLAELQCVLGGAWTTARCHWSLINGDEEQTLADETLHKLDLSSSPVLLHYIPPNFANYIPPNFAISTITFGIKRPLPRSIERNTTSSLNVLPHDILMLVFAKLPILDLAHCMRTCREFTLLLNLDLFWAVLLKRDFNREACMFTPAKDDYKMMHSLFKRPRVLIPKAIMPIESHVLNDWQDIVARHQAQPGFFRRRVPVDHPLAELQADQLPDDTVLANLPVLQLANAPSANLETESADDVPPPHEDADTDQDSELMPDIYPNPL